MDFFRVADFQREYKVDYPIRMGGLLIMDITAPMYSSYFQLKHQFGGLTLLFCKNGELHIKINNLSYSVSKGATLTILPEMWIEPISYSEDCEAVVFVMDYDFIEKYTILPEFISNTEVLDTPVIYPNKQDNELIEELSLLIRKQYSLPKTYLLEQMLQYLIYSLITVVSKSYYSMTLKENLQKNRVNDIMDCFFELLDEYGVVERNVSFYATHLHLTPQHLSSLIKKRTGKSVKSWIGFAVINKAKEYLNTTSLSVKQISDQLEFADASLFCRYFKRYIGQTPNEYRKS
ncbi:helix-turn-helix domain-containing protein [Myroides odoratimimus]|uniref:helix-turn-helix domain-containing protein n=2 Tax=Myroides odoratimimus TaxID=76832 RepID=UPI0004A7D170|nr:helix-turn-helix domain-containing protein [Myroides odoratimimus]